MDGFPKAPDTSRAGLWQQVRASPLYDLAMRLPGAAWVLGLLVHEVLGARDVIAAQLDLSDPTFLLAVLGRAALMIFLGLQGIFFIARRRAVLQVQGVYPWAVGMLGATLSLAIILLPHPPVRPIFNMLSIALILIGNYLSILVVMRLGRSLSILPEGRRLVTDGPYRWIRHPLYLTEEIVVIGVFLQFRTVLAAAILIVHFVFQLLRMREEEKVLVQAFPEYADYKTRTARLIPGLY